MYSSMLFASQQISPLTDTLYRTRHLNEFNSSSSRLLYSLSSNLLQNCTNHGSSITKENSNNIDWHIYLSLQHKDFRESISFTPTQRKNKSNINPVPKCDPCVNSNFCLQRYNRFD